jgi:hypothetical protein
MYVPTLLPHISNTWGKMGPKVIIFAFLASHVTCDGIQQALMCKVRCHIKGTLPCSQRQKNGGGRHFIHGISMGPKGGQEAREVVTFGSYSGGA